MKKLLLGGVVILALMEVDPGFSADLPIKAAPPPPVIASAYSWTGCYLGGHIGGGFGQKDWSVDASDRNTNTSNASIFGLVVDNGGPVDLGSQIVTGFLGGIQGGCDYQFGSHLVLGAQADFSWANLQSTFTNSVSFVASNGNVFGESFTAHTRVEGMGTITGRIGYSSDRALFYMKGGAAGVRDKYSIADVFYGGQFTEGALAGSASLNRWDWTVGAGFEYALLPNLSTFIEYDFLDFGTRRTVFNCQSTAAGTVSCGNDFSTPRSTVPLDIRQQVHAIKLGLNYRFNWGRMATPVVARY